MKGRARVGHVKGHSKITSNPVYFLGDDEVVVCLVLLAASSLKAEMGNFRVSPSMDLSMT